MRNSEIKVLSTTIQGLRNSSRNMPCQDYCKHSTKGKNFVAIISDGAGSAKHSKIGARVICETLTDLLANAHEHNIKKSVAFAIEVARDKLRRHRLNKTKDEEGINDFAATIVGMIYCRGKGLFFHIGDGAAIAFNNNNFDKYTISKPENGFFSCETYFYTMNDWKENLRFTEFKNFNTFILMTDGLTNFSFSKDFNTIQAGFLSPINDFLLNEPVKAKALKALKKTLGNPKAEKINPDDKTILWAKVL
ncbi:MAG: protein phosphatase 2C domain-containing protein [Lactobacillaceae bacterium]|jgi:serine/threonine protein phosphatase PrpC|nr:protein phosphatase 2C domain-containing protein [Lactobacillaceae bacterium]